MNSGILNSVKNKSERLAAAVSNRFSDGKVFYLTEQADWVIRRIGKVLESDSIKGFRMTASAAGLRNSVVHYGTPYGLWSRDKINAPHASNKLVVTWFHVLPDDNRLALLPQINQKVALWHTASSLTKNKLVKLGLPEDRIVLVPLGVDLKIFKPCAPAEKENIRKELGLPQNKIIIGSFQKDGVGWGKGLQPKLIKGPDLFCDVVLKLAKSKEIFVLLVGPARGYVIDRLTRAGISFKHFLVDKYEDVGRYYRALDLYLVTAREEGGPLAVLESMASGIPVVSTKVGLVPDVIEERANGALAEVGDVEGLADRAAELIEKRSLRELFRENGHKRMQAYDWPLIAGEYRRKIYERLLNLE